MPTTNRNKIEAKQLDEQPILVNGISIAEEDIECETRQCTQSREIAAANLVIRQLLLQEVDADALINQGEERAIQRLLDQRIKLPEAEEETYRRYYDNNRRQFRSPDLYEVSHILLSAAPYDLAARDRQRGLAERLIEQLQIQPEKFTEFAQSCSDCPSKQAGGRLGQISRGSTIPEFEDVLFRLGEGLHSQPVESRYGYHIVRVDRKIDGEPLDYAAVRESIASHLYRHSQRQAIRQYIEQLVSNADIRGIELQSLHRIQP